MPYPYMIIHNCRIEVVWVDEYTLSFPAAFGQYFYGRTPSIIATTESTHTDGSTDASEMGNVNVHVDDIDLVAQTAILRFSAPFTGTVNIRAIVT